MKHLFAFLVLISFVSVTAAQSVKPSRVIQGTISNNRGKPLPSAKVFVPETNINYASNGQGEYSFSLPENVYHLEISAPGYVKQVIEISLLADTVLDVVMETPFGGLALDDVDIFAVPSSKVASGVSGLNTIDGSMIEDLPAVLGEKDVMRSMQLLPGVAAGSEGSTEMNVRGGSSDQNLIMLDNVPLYNSTHLFGMYSSFNPLIVENASIYTGAFPAAYGGKISSVSDVVTKAASMDSLSGSAELGITSAKAMVEIPLIKGKSSLLLAGRRTFIDLLQSLDRSGQSERFNFYDLNVVWTYRYGEKSSLKLSAYQEGDAVRLMTSGDGKREDAFGKKQRTMSLQWRNFTTGTFNQEVGLQYNLYRSRILEDRPDMNRVPYRHEFTSQIKDLAATYQLQYRPSNFLDLRAGAGFTQHRLQPAYFSGHENQQPFSVYSLPNATIGEVSGFAEANLTYGSGRVVLGVRANQFHSRPKAYNSLEPRASISQQVGNTLSLKAAYAKMSQPMQRLVNPGLGLPLDIMYPADEFIKPQVADIFSAGFSNDLKIGNSRYTLSAEGYLKKMENIISLKDGYDTRSVILHNAAEAVFKTENIQDMLVMGKGKAIGADFMLEKKEGRLSGWLSYSWIRATHQFDGLNGGREFRAAEDRTHVFNAVANWKINDAWSLSATWMFSTGRPINVPESVFESSAPTLEGNHASAVSYLYSYGERNSHRMKSFHKLDIGLTRKLQLWDLDSELNLGLYNVYNRANASFYYMGESFAGESGLRHPTLKAVSMFPVLPAVSFKVRF